MRPTHMGNNNAGTLIVTGGWAEVMSFTSVIKLHSRLNANEVSTLRAQWLPI
ncbi:MAG: hypothetical protein RIS65_1665 [Pseudomonadota bacterium]|jgi:hypothetical protein